MEPRHRGDSALTMTTFLAIYGAVLATILAIVEGLRFYLDRARLNVTSQLTVNANGAWMRVVVINRGRQTTTVREAGFKVQAHHEFTGPDGRTFTGDRWIKLDEGAHVLEPGQPVTFEWDVFQRGSRCSSMQTSPCAPTRATSI